MSAGVADGFESKPLVKMRRAIRFLNVKRHRKFLFSRFDKQVSNQRGSDAAAATLGEKRYIRKSNLARRSDHNELSNRLSFERDDAVINFERLRLIVPLLSAELQSKKHVRLRRVPS